MSRWSEVGEAFRASFSTMCAGTIPMVLDELSLGRLLDVGCGTGSLLVEAKRRGFSVTGVDQGSDMVAMSSEAAQVRVLHGALPDLPVEAGAFDALTCNFVINHVPDPRAAMRELARVVRPGGRLVATIWTAEGSGASALIAEVFAAAGVPPVPPTHLPPELDFPRSVEGLAGIAREAEFDVVSSGEVTWTWEVPPESLWVGIRGGVAAAGATYQALVPHVQRRVEECFFARAQADAVNGLLHLPCRAVLLVAERPEVTA